MKLKLDDKGNVIVQDGKPVYVRDDGTDFAFDAPATMQTISRLNGEAKSHREGKEAAEAKLKVFEGIADPDAARKALDMVGKIDAKQLVDSKGIEALREQMTSQHKNETDRLRQEVEGYKRERDTALNDLNTTKIGNSFATSKFISDKIAVPVDMIQAAFGNAFKVENGKIVAYGKDGNQIFSPSKFGEPADFDEALEVLVNGYNHRDAILKGSGMNGGGSNGGGNGAGGKARYSRDEYENMDYAKQAVIAGDVRSGKAEIVDKD